MAAANGNGNHPRRDGSALLNEAGDISDAAHVISRLADGVSDGAGAQARSLDTALAGMSQLAGSLRDTSGQAESVAGSAESLVSSINEMAASIAQVSTSTDSLTSTTRDVAGSIQ